MCRPRRLVRCFGTSLAVYLVMTEPSSIRIQKVRPGCRTDNGHYRTMAVRRRTVQASHNMCGQVDGGPSRNRTGVRGFAVLYVTTPPSGRGEGRISAGQRSLSTASLSTNGGVPRGRLRPTGALRAWLGCLGRIRASGRRRPVPFQTCLHLRCIRDIQQ